MGTSQMHSGPSTGPATEPTALDLIEEDLLDNSFLMASMFAVESGEDVSGPVAATDFSTRAIALFPDLDDDGDGFLTDDDIAAAVTDPDLTGPDAAVVATLNQLKDELEELSDDEWGDENDGITLPDLQAYERTGAVPGGLRARVEGRYAYGTERIAAGADQLFGADGVPSAAGVHQGALGDCFFLAAVAAVVARDPQTIVDLITPNEDGTYTVQFPNQQPVTVPGPTDAEIAQYAASKADGFWVTLLEKAYGVIQNPDAAIPSEGADELIGGSLASGIAFITGHSVNTDMIAMNDAATIEARLTAAFDEGRIVTCSIRRGFGNDQGLPMGHAYSVLDWDPSGRVLTIRNPWGHGERTDTPDGTDDGTFTVTFDEFLEMFTLVAFEEGA